MPKAETAQTATTTAQPRNTYFFVLTLDVPGQMQFTTHGTYNPPEGATRQDAYLEVRQHAVQMNPGFERANVAFFSLERNEL